ncbi:hypothetical protein [Mobilicoccus pelagius]|nr:hypothetical protein [Mobilicoccus pelagius]
MSRSIRSAQIAAVAAAAVAVPLGAAPASAATTAPARTPRACVTSGCTIVSRADVDGDGRADTTSLTRRDKGRAHTLRVVTAKGAVASTTFSTTWLPSGLSPFYGATALDGARGSELVVLTQAGAHTLYHAVYTWRGGRLVAEKDPSGARDWVTDGAVSFAQGYTLRTVKGTKQLTSVAYSRDSFGRNATFSGRRIVARWQHGRWTPITDRAMIVKESPSVWTGAGWNAPGLTRFL